MFELNIDTRIASVKRREKITAGSVGIQCGFTFSSDWDGLGKIAVFETDKHKIVVVLNTPTVTIPWEVCEEANLDVIVGVYGTNANGTIVIPTIYAKLGTVAVGTTTSGASNAQTPTSTNVQQITTAAANAVSTANTAKTTADDAKSIAQRVEQRANSGEFDGSDGFSPEVSVHREGNAVEIYVVDKNGTQEVTVFDGANGTDGKDGKDGKDGTSVTITNISESSESGGVNTVTFSDGNELHVKNGLDGQGGGSDVTDEHIKEVAETETLKAALADKANKSEVPTTLASLTADSTHRTVTDAEKSAWNAKSNFDGRYASLTGKPTIPAAVTESTVAEWGFAKTDGLGYATPQMYGAYGDGVHDDTEALNACLHDNKFVIVPKGYYRITSKLTAECRDALTVVADAKAVFVADSTVADCMLELSAYVGYSMIGVSWTGGVFCCSGVSNLTGIKVNNYCSFGHFKDITVIDIGDGGTGVECNITSGKNDFDGINIFSATFNLHPENPDGNLSINHYDLSRTTVGFKSIGSFDCHIGSLMVMGCTVGIQTDGGAQVTCDCYHYWVGSDGTDKISVAQYKKTRGVQCLNANDHWYFGTLYPDKPYIAIEAGTCSAQNTHYIATLKSIFSDLDSWDDPCCYLGLLTTDYGTLKFENLDVHIDNENRLQYRGITQNAVSTLPYRRNGIRCEYIYPQNFGYLHPSLAWNNSESTYAVTYNKGNKYVIGYAMVDLNGTADIELTGHQNVIAASFSIASKTYSACVYNDFSFKASQAFDITISLGTIIAANGFNWAPIILETTYSGTMTNIAVNVKVSGSMPVVPCFGTLYTGSTIHSKKLKTEKDADSSTLPSALGVGF